MTLTYIAEGQTAHHHKHMSRDRYPLLLRDVTARAENISRDRHILLCDVTVCALHSDSPSMDTENTAACVAGVV
jgi:hypothetical protein